MGAQVVLVLDGLYVAGAQRHCLELLRLFGKRGMSRIVVALEGGGRWADHFLADSEHLIVGNGAEVRWSDIQDLLPGISPAFVSAQLMTAVEWASSNLAGVSTCFAHLHCEPSEHEDVTAAWMHSHLPQFHRVFVPARSTLDTLTSLLSLADPLREKFVVLPNSLPRTAKTSGPRRLRGPRLQIATVSRIDADKFSVPAFLGALEFLNDTGVEFEVKVAGDGELLPSLKEVVSRRSWGAAVQFLGFADDVNAIYDWADVVFIPSKRESAPYVLLEALAVCRPIVGPDTGVLSELRGAEPVLLYTPGDGADAGEKLIGAGTATDIDTCPTTARLPSRLIPEYSDWESLVWEAYGR